MISIPAKIHLVFLSKKESIPEIFIDCIANIKKLHPNWEITTYNEDDAKRILTQHTPYLLEIYNKYEHIVQKADIFRIILVYLYGGFYLDMDMYCLKSLNSLRKFKLVLAEEKTLTKELCNKLNLKVGMRVANYMFGSVPKHPFWLEIICEALRRSRQLVKSENDILEITGPGLFSDVFSQKRNNYNDIVLLRNYDRRCLMPSHNVVSCYFGNYATHLHQGTWRWGNITYTKEANLKDSLPSSQSLQMAISRIKMMLPPNKLRKYKLRLISASSGRKEYQTMLHSIKQLRNLRFPQCIFLVCGNPTAFKSKISLSNVNVLYTSHSTSSVIKDWSALINAKYRCCILTSQFAKEVFEHSGVTIPIFVIHPGFVRPPRNFTEGDDVPFFNIAFSVNSENLKFYICVLKALKLISVQVPQVQLKVIIEDASVNNFVRKISRLTQVVFATGNKDEIELSDWYKDVHCNVYLNDSNSFPFEPHLSLYLGIPTIINKTVETQKLLNSKYYYNLDLDSDGTDNNLEEKCSIKVYEAALRVYMSYSTAQIKAARGAHWIEDKFQKEDTEQQIIKIVNSIL